MLEYCLSINSQGVYTVWVTINEELRSRVKFFFIALNFLNVLGKSIMRTI